jgi:hypothetical protein
MRRGALLVLAAALLGGCATVPGPEADTDSLVVLYNENPPHSAAARETGIDTLRFTGPSSFAVSLGGREGRVHCVRVKPGRYAVETPGPFAGWGGAAPSDLDIPPAAVVLYPLKVTRLPAHRVTRVCQLAPLTPEDRRTASAMLTDIIDYGKWFGRASEGFGAWPPRLGEEPGTVPFTVASTPPGARVIVDGEEWGSAPAATSLRPGRHLVQVEMPGAAHRQYVEVKEGGEITIPLAPGGTAENDGKIVVLLTAFRNLGSADGDALRPFFSQAIRTELLGSPGLSVAEPFAPVPAGASSSPDFQSAGRQGMDLVIGGWYSTRGGALFVYAALYDVQSEAALASTLYTGTVGLSLFDSIDEMALRFTRGVEAALRQRQAAVAERSAAVDARVVAYQRQRARTALVEKRQLMRDSLSVVIGPSWAGASGTRLPSGFAAVSALAPLGLLWEHSLAGPFSLTASIQPAVAFENSASGGDPSIDYIHNGFVDIPLRFGPAYTLFGPEADLTFALQGEGRFAQAYFDDGAGGAVYKPLWIVGLGIQTSARLYLQTRLSERPTFLLLGFTWFAMGMQTEVDFTRPRIIPMELSLLFGYGARL